MPTADRLRRQAPAPPRRSGSARQTRGRIQHTGLPRELRGREPAVLPPLDPLAHVSRVTRLISASAERATRGTYRRQERDWLNGYGHHRDETKATATVTAGSAENRRRLSPVHGGAVLPILHLTSAPAGWAYLLVTVARSRPDDQ